MPCRWIETVQIFFTLSSTIAASAALLLYALDMITKKLRLFNSSAAETASKRWFSFAKHVSNDSHTSIFGHQEQPRGYNASQQRVPDAMCDAHQSNHKPSWIAEPCCGPSVVLDTVARLERKLSSLEEVLRQLKLGLTAAKIRREHYAEPRHCITTKEECSTSPASPRVLSTRQSVMSSHLDVAVFDRCPFITSKQEQQKPFILEHLDSSITLNDLRTGSIVSVDGNAFPFQNVQTESTHPYTPSVSSFNTMDRKRHCCFKRSNEFSLSGNTPWSTEKTPSPVLSSEYRVLPNARFQPKKTHHHHTVPALRMSKTAVRRQPLYYDKAHSRFQHPRSTLHDGPTVNAGSDVSFCLPQTPRCSSPMPFECHWCTPFSEV